MYSRGQRISSGNRAESRQGGAPGRQQSYPRQGERAGHHRGLRAGHAFRGVIRELGRASRLLGSHRRKAGDRRKQHPGVCRWTRAVNEPTWAQARRNTKHSASTQGTGREPKANQPEWTKAVVATRSTAGSGGASSLDRKRGELRPKGPTIQAARRREGEAGHDLWARERQARHRAQQPVSTQLAWIAIEGSNVSCAWTGNRPGSLAERPVLTNRMREFFTYGSVGGAGGNPGPYPAPNSRPRCQLRSSAEARTPDSRRAPSSGGCGWRSARSRVSV
jgi:hypothetical protein